MTAEEVYNQLKKVTDQHWSWTDQMMAISSWIMVKDAQKDIALKTVDKYFIDLQNRCALTPHEEMVWKNVSRAINQP